MATESRVFRKCRRRQITSHWTDLLQEFKFQIRNLPEARKMGNYGEQGHLIIASNFLSTSAAAARPTWFRNVDNVRVSNFTFLFRFLSNFPRSS